MELEKLSYTRTFGYPTERLTGGHFSVPVFIKHDAIQHLRPMTEDIFWAYCIFMLKKSTPLLPSFNMLVLRVLEAGINYAWETKVVLFHTNSRTQQIIRYHYYHGEDTETVSLQWMHVQGAFGILAFGYAIAFLCFLIEQVVHKYKTPT
ncbi:uncharacterized protein LOC108733206 [Agrilus planipennis]|uniref:Uncharacterized protein LOC108733206 n=1 Tax=Agrilus planipennis TaxID=224129 RepID=A0A1W4WI58_AGRPL|nr:uncharacterized protein LOC108733206 [Agrilus planipennis]